MTKLLVVDTETGGLDHERHALLSVGLVALEEMRNDILSIRDMVEVKVQAFGEVEQRAIEINKIDLDKHNKQALTTTRAAEVIETFIICNMAPTQYATKAKDDGPSEWRPNVVLAGWNVCFDRDMLSRLWLHVPWMNVNVHAKRAEGMQNWWRKTISHHTLDVQAVCRFLYLAGVLPQFGGLDSALAHFGVQADEKDRHTAIGDALATARLLVNLRAFVRENWGAWPDWMMA